MNEVLQHANAALAEALQSLVNKHGLEVAVADGIKIWARISEKINSQMLGFNYPKSPEDVSFLMWGTVIGIVLGYLGVIQSKNVKGIDVLKFYAICGFCGGLTIDILEDLTNSSAFDLAIFIPRLFNLFG